MKTFYFTKYGAVRSFMQDTHHGYFQPKTLIGEYEKNIKEMEKEELLLFSLMIEHLSKFSYIIKEYREFKCNCAVTMRVMELHSRARDGLQNKLPQLQKDVELVTSQLQNTADLLLKTLADPTRANQLEWLEKFSDMLQLIYAKQVEYKNMKPNFVRLAIYFRKKINSLPVFNNKMTTIRDIIEAHDNIFIDSIFTDDPSYSEDQKIVLKNLIKNIFESSHCKMEELNTATVTREMTEETRKLKAFLDRIITNFPISLKHFQRFKMS